jgi:hypothetical protein
MVQTRVTVKRWQLQWLILLLSRRWNTLTGLAEARKRQDQPLQLLPRRYHHLNHAKDRPDFPVLYDKDFTILDLSCHTIGLMCAANMKMSPIGQIRAKLVHALVKEQCPHLLELDPRVVGSALQSHLKGVGIVSNEAKSLWNRVVTCNR